MQKTYVIDTNVLIQAPYALESFEDNHIVLPLTVLEELDGLKDRPGDCGANARAVIRRLEQLRRSGDLVHGVTLPGGGSLRLEVNHVNVALPHGFQPGLNDNRILKVCKGLTDEGSPTTLVTRDIIVRLKAQLMGIPAEDFTTDQVEPPAGQYAGRCEAYVPDECMAGFRKKGADPCALYTCGEDGARRPVSLSVNQFCLLRSETRPTRTQLGFYNGAQVVALRHSRQAPFGVRPKNVGQHFLQEALLEPCKNAPLVIVKGPAGTAKTFYSLAVGLHSILNEKEPAYRKILLCRSNAQFDKDIGFLPGDEQEKIAPLLRPVLDNLEVLVDSDEKERYKNEAELRGKVDFLFTSGVITAEAINFIRGRSICCTYLIIDEAQNLTPRQVKGILTRAGQGTKIILLGDPQQIDNPLLDAQTNGLSYASAHMRGSPLCWQVTMLPEECERSQLAMDAAQRM